MTGSVRASEPLVPLTDPKKGSFDYFDQSRLVAEPQAVEVGQDKAARAAPRRFLVANVMRRCAILASLLGRLFAVRLGDIERVFVHAGLHFAQHRTSRSDLFVERRTDRDLVLSNGQQAARGSDLKGAIGIDDCGEGFHIFRLDRPASQHEFDGVAGGGELFRFAVFNEPALHLAGGIVTAAGGRTEAYGDE